MITRIKVNILKILRFIRAPLVRFIKPKSGYFLFEKKDRPPEPISYKYGFDRGLPIDRYYIEKFMEENSHLVKGHCLEIHDNAYTIKYGGDRITKSDALDIDRTNKESNIYGDLRSLDNIPDNTYDTIILTHTINMIDDFESSIEECHRILKPGGWLLATLPSVVGPVFHLNDSYWRFTTASAKYSFGKYFHPSEVEVKSYGNVLAGQAFWVGLSVEDISKDKMDYNDPHYPITVALKVQKKSHPDKTVTVGVSALNEEANIIDFLNSVLNQKQNGFVLEKIIVISDGSTDWTVRKAKSIDDPRIEVREYDKRLGQPARMNEMFLNLTSDVLVKCDADVVLGHNNVISELIYEFADEKTGMVCGSGRPLKPTTTMEKAVALTRETYMPLIKIMDGNNRHFVNGRLMALKRELANQVTIPQEIIGNDVYCYFECLSKGYQFRRVGSAVVYYQAPRTIRDHVRQNIRFIAVSERMSDYFPRKLVEKESYKPKGLLLGSMIKQGLRHPFLAAFIFFVNSYCRLLLLKGDVSELTSQWSIAETSKNILNK